MQISTSVRRIALFLLSMVLSSSILFAQERTVTGKVSAEGEGPLPGVNVTVQGTVIGAITDLNGAYSIKVPGPASILLFSSVGYSTKQVTVGTQTVIDIVLVSDVTALSEVVVTGYTSQRRRDLTGAVGVVEPAKLTAVPTSNVNDALQGRSSGVTVTGNGQPNSTAKVRIRGFSSFENNDPLYVVDGVPITNPDAIASMNPNDIQSLSVLKDAGAASIYGSRASNGVIIVTTKKGGIGSKVNFSMYYGMQYPGNGPDNLLTTQEYANLQWLVNKNDGIKTGTSIYGDFSNPTPTLPTWAANTNWYKAITRVAGIQNYDLSLSGGTTNSKFFAAVGVRQQDGIVMYTFDNKYTLRFNSEFTFLDGHVKFGENFSGTYGKNLGVSNLGEGSPIQLASYREQSIIPVVWTGDDFVGISHTFKAGDWGGTGLATGLGNTSNQVAAQTRSKDNFYHNIRIIGNTYVDVKILQGLNFKSTLGGTFFNDYGGYYNYITYENSENQLSNSYNEYADVANDWVWTNQITFDKTFGQHKILAVVGYEADKYDIGRGLSAGRGGYFTDNPNYRTLSNGSSINYANSYFNTPTTLVSQFARADYSFMDRYMLSATVRRDGSSKFGSSTRYGVFPSFSAGWRISDEPFFQGVTFINDLKLRGSYGTMGNQQAVSSQNQFSFYGGSPSTTFYALNGSFSSSAQGFAASRIGNPNAKWETNITSDIGIEGSLLKSKIGFKIDYYTKKTKDLLYAPELPGVVGVASPPYINIAAMSNKGIDAELSYKDKFGDFGLDASAILTTYKNNIDKIAEGVNFFDQQGGVTRIGGNSNNRNEVGHPMSAFFGYKEQGLFQQDQFHLADVIDPVTKLPVIDPVTGKTKQYLAQNTDIATQDGAQPGLLRFQDINGDGKITPLDRTFIGNPNPKFTYGFNLGLNYKGFDLSAFVYGSYGNDIFDWNKYFIDFWPAFQGQKSKELLYNSWTPDNPNAKVPMATSISNFSTNLQVNSYYMEKGSYARMRNLELGYTLPQSVVSKIKISSLRVYIQAVNLFTITKYSGLDPELGGDDRAFGSDTGNYPLVKNLIFGLNLNF